MQTIDKLRPDRDLQCYFYQPSAIAALSGTGPTGFTVSGCWRQQFDWAVIEWNRDDIFEHPAIRPLPDGDLSGLTLSYEETRSNCISLDSDLFPTVDWPWLRIWTDAGNGGQEQIYWVPLSSYATPVEGQYTPASAQISLNGTVTAGDYVGFAFLDEHYSYEMRQGDTLAYALEQLHDAINSLSSTMSAALEVTTLTLTCSIANFGANGNRIGLYTYVSGAATERWDCEWRQFSGGTSPGKWQINLPFGALEGALTNTKGAPLQTVPTSRVRKMRWTYAADLQPGAFEQSEFQVIVSNWTVTGSGRTYNIAGPGSQRFEDDDPLMTYVGPWSSSAGNYSGGFTQATRMPSASVSCLYSASAAHELYVGTRLCATGANVSYSVDASAPAPLNLNLQGEDVLVRIRLGSFAAGDHTVTITHQDSEQTYFYFDFLEAAIPTQGLPVFNQENRLALATDWDTQHSTALAPERTAWLISTLGFRGRANHYAGALWFYELVCSGQQYASATITFNGTPDPNLTTAIRINRTDDPPENQTTISHLNVIGDTGTTLAKAFELLINGGYTAVRAQSAGNQLTIYAREMGDSGNAITVSTSDSTTNLTIQVSGTTLSGGIDGAWLTDLQATPRINRAARDWHASFFGALKGYGIDATAAFSMELGNGDPSPEAGIAQRYPSQAAVTLNTPALQTNFSPASAGYWQQVYADMAAIQTAAGLTPYLQFGEVQWWYKPDDGSGMPFYDAYTAAQFESQYGRTMQVITSNDIDPATVADEAAFLPGLIGDFTTQICQYVRQTCPTCRFEVLYPVDVNSARLNAVVNYPTSAWTPGAFDCLKTESFTFTYSRNLESCKQSIDAAFAFGFSPSQRSHLVGIGDARSPWLKEARIAQAGGLESVVLFALDQLCLIGYRVPLPQGARRSLQMG